MRYTVVYSVYLGGNCYISQMERVETDDITTLLDTDKYQYGVHFIFEGWPKLEGEDNNITIEEGNQDD